MCPDPDPSPSAAAAPTTALSSAAMSALVQSCGSPMALVHAHSGQLRWCNAAWADTLDTALQELVPTGWLKARGTGVSGLQRDGQRFRARAQAQPVPASAEAPALVALSLFELQADTPAQDGPETQSGLFDAEALSGGGQDGLALQLAVSLSRIGIWRQDLHTGLVTCNAQARDLFGMDPEVHCAPMPEIRALVHPADMALVVRAAERSLLNPGPTDIQARYPRRDGAGWRHVLTRRVLERDASGQAVAFVGVALDVSERTEEAARAQDLSDRLELATTGAWIGVWSRDVGNGSGEWSDRMFEIYGRDPAKGVPSHADWVPLVHPDDMDRMARNREHLLANDEGILEQEFRVIGDDGRVRWVGNWARLELRAGRSVIVGIAMDVTERVNSAAALRGAHERADLAARGAGMGTWEWNVVDNTAVWDDTMFVLRGLAPRAEALDEAERMAIAHPDDRERVSTLLRAAVATGETANYEFRVVWPDGSVHWLASHSTPVFDDDGAVRRHIGINWDITETHEAAQARREREIAQRESQAKSVFLARMSHELRTPLNAVLGFAQLLQLDADPLTEAQRSKVAHIRTAGEHLLSLINDVLDLSSLDSEHRRPQSQATTVHDLVTQALPLIHASALQRDIALHIGPLPGVVQVDPMRMRQVLLNLLSNAVKYNRASGEVWVSSHDDGSTVRIEVRDSGLGLSEAQRMHLFEPFNRLGAESTGVEGTGMGLVIAKAMVEHMAGRIEVCSTPGAGSSFALVFDTPSGTLQAHPPPPEAANPSVRPRARGRLLYIEDNEVNVLVFEELVRSRSDISVHSAPTAALGVAHALSQPPDLVVIDMQLPDGSGFDVLRALHADPRTRCIPCVALSANALPEAITAARSAGFAEYWTKPLDFARFEVAMQRWFAGSHRPPDA
jgi:PAS domain S-box-containing protein